MKKLSALLILTMLLSACAAQPEQTATTTAETTTTAAVTATEEATTTEMATTTAESTTPALTTIAPSESPISFNSYIIGEYDGISRLEIGRNALGDNVVVFLLGINAEKDDNAVITADSFELVVTDNRDEYAADIETITFLPFIDAKKYAFDPYRQPLCVNYFNGRQDNQLFCLYLPASETCDLYFFAVKDGEISFFNSEPFETSGMISFDREKNIVADEINRIEYSFDFENMTYSSAEPLPVEAEEYAPDYSYEDSRLDFLSDEQNETWIKSQFIKSFSISSSSAQLPWSDEMTDDYYFPTNISYTSFAGFAESAFTYDALPFVIDETSFRNVDGFVYWMDGARGGDIDYRGCTFELVSKDENTVKFKCVAYYNSAESYAEYSENDPNSYIMEYPLEMVNTKKGWRMEYYDLWY